MLRRLSCFVLLALLLISTGSLSAQNTWEGFWDGMETALVALGTNPTQAYFERLYHPDLPNHDRVFQGLVSEANALTDMQITYPILIFDGAYAAYQRVVTGMFTQPYVIGNTTLPPTNAPVRYVTQGIMVVSGAGRIFADNAVTDGFAKFQEFGAIPLAPGQEHGRIGIEPYAGDTAESAFAPGLSEFTRFSRAGAANARQEPDVEPPLTIQWFVGLGDGGSETARAAIDEFNQTHPNLHIEMNTNFGSAEADGSFPTRPYTGAWLDLAPVMEASDPAQIDIEASVSQDEWSAYFATITLQPDTSILIPNLAEPLIAQQPIQFPIFAFEYLYLDEQRFQGFITMDTLAIFNEAGINPGAVAITEPAEPTGQNLAQWYRDHMGQDPLITPANAVDLNIIGTFTPEEVESIVRAVITPELSADESWLTQTAQTGIFLQNGGNAVFDGTLVAGYRPGGGIFVVDTLTNQPLASFAADLTDAPTLHFDPVDPIVYAGTPFRVRAFNYETDEEVVFEAFRGASDYVSITHDDGFLTAVTAGNDGKMTIATYTDGAKEPAINVIDTGAGSDLRRVLVGGWWVVALDGNDQLIGIWNTLFGDQLPIIIGDATVSSSTAVNFDIPGLLALGTSDGQIHLFDVEHGNQVNQLNVGTEPIIHISVSPDTTLMGAFSADNSMTVFAAGVPGEAGAEQTSSTASSGETSSSLPTPTPSPAPTSTPAGTVCTVRPTTNANIRSNPDANSARVDTAQTGVDETADGATQAADGYKWYHLKDGGWIRGDLVVPGEGCENLPNVEAAQ